jgi:phospholipid/cholesterol/gamma-HCH transport system ATP-binding protein
VLNVLSDEVYSGAVGNDTAIYVRHLRKSFEGKDVLRDISMELRKGENVVLLGKSGEGKSVTLKCLVGLEQQDSGIVKVLGREVSTLSEDELREMRLKVGYLFQHGALYDSMTVYENLEFPLTRVLKIHNGHEVKQRIEEALEAVGLTDSQNRLPSELSGGQCKRIALARMLILKPEVILYDEPTTGLDPITSCEISNLIVKTQQLYKTSSVIITHDIPCARITGDRLMVLHNGQFIGEGKFEDLAQSENELINSFFK